jgi:hypothetical protein
MLDKLGGGHSPARQQGSSFREQFAHDLIHQFAIGLAFVSRHQLFHYGAYLRGAGRANFGNDGARCLGHLVATHLLRQVVEQGRELSLFVGQ